MRKNVWIRMAAVMAAGVLGVSGCGKGSQGTAGSETQSAIRISFP